MERNYKFLLNYYYNYCYYQRSLTYINVNKENSKENRIAFELFVIVHNLVWHYLHLCMPCKVDLTSNRSSSVLILRLRVTCHAGLM